MTCCFHWQPFSPTHGVSEQDLSWILPCPSACTRLQLASWTLTHSLLFGVFSEMGFQVLVCL